ncbi:MAG: hypothetical protein KDK39_06770 [Leptospiraceae bacterium]|nr:hypothetical protein [Leptospiraceae bacterium]
MSHRQIITGIVLLGLSLPRLAEEKSQNDVTVSVNPAADSIPGVAKKSLIYDFYQGLMAAPSAKEYQQ